MMKKIRLLYAVSAWIVAAGAISVAQEPRSVIVIADPLTGTPGEPIDGRITPTGGAVWCKEWPWTEVSEKGAIIASDGIGITRGENQKPAAASLFLPDTYTDSILTVEADIQIGVRSETGALFGAIGFSDGQKDGTRPKGPVANPENSVLTAYFYKDSSWHIVSGSKDLATGVFEMRAEEHHLRLIYDQSSKKTSLFIDDVEVASGVPVPATAMPVEVTGFELFDGDINTGKVSNFQFSVSSQEKK